MYVRIDTMASTARLLLHCYALVRGNSRDKGLVTKEDEGGRGDEEGVVAWIGAGQGDKREKERKEAEQRIYCDIVKELKEMQHPMSFIIVESSVMQCVLCAVATRCSRDQLFLRIRHLCASRLCDCCFFSFSCFSLFTTYDRYLLLFSIIFLNIVLKLDEHAFTKVTNS
jgi:hypothetical protein